MTKKAIILSTGAAILLTFGAVSVPLLAANATTTTYSNNVSIAVESVLASGSWGKKTFKSSGTWQIYSENGSTFVKLSSDFKTRKAPDLKIFLSPLAASATTGRNATQGSVLIAPLSSNSGEQVYQIPEGVDITDYRSILIHCEAYSKLWSAADL